MEAAKISALSSAEIVKYEYLAGKEILPPDKSRIIDQAKFTYSPWRKAFLKNIYKWKTIENQEGKQVRAIEQQRKKLAESNALIKKHD